MLLRSVRRRISANKTFFSDGAVRAYPFIFLGLQTKSGLEEPPLGGKPSHRLGFWKKR